MCSPNVKANPGGRTAVGGGLEVVDKDARVITKVSTTVGERVILMIRPKGGKQGKIRNIRWTVHRGKGRVLESYSIYPFKGKPGDREWEGDNSLALYATTDQQLEDKSNSTDYVESHMKGGTFAKAFAHGGKFLICVEADIELSSGGTQHAEAIVTVEVKAYSLTSFSLNASALVFGAVRNDGCNTLQADIDSLSFNTDAPHKGVLCQYFVTQHSTQGGANPAPWGDAWTNASRADGWGTKASGPLQTFVKIPPASSGYQLHFVRVYCSFFLMTRGSSSFSAEKAWAKKYQWTSPGFLHCTFAACIDVQAQRILAGSSVVEGDQLDPDRALRGPPTTSVKLSAIQPTTYLPVQGPAPGLSDL